MSQAFPQLGMQWLYGLSHYIFRVSFDIAFRGEVRGLENLPVRGGFLLAANHASFIDPPLIGCHVEHQIVYFARKTLWKRGFASWWLDTIDAIPVDRDGGQDVNAIKRVLRALRDERVIILFPEGTRTLDGRFQPARPGVGFIACKTRVPVVPVRIFGSFEAFGKSHGLRLGTPVSVVFGRPLPPSFYDEPGAGRERSQIASDRIMAEIARLECPAARVI